MTYSAPTATAIDMQSYPRKDWFDYFCAFDNPLIYKTIQFDVTELRKFCRENNLKFSLTIGFILTRAANHVAEFRHRIHDDVVVEYDKVVPVLTVLKTDRILEFMQGVYTDRFADDYHENVAIQARVRSGVEMPPRGNDLGRMFITTNPWTTHSAAQLPFARRLASIPGFIVGKIQEEAGRMKLAISLQVHHALMDGYHVGHLVHNVQCHLDDPTLIQRDYQSLFESTSR